MEKRVLKQVKMKLPPEIVEGLTRLAGGTAHRAAYITKMLQVTKVGDAYFYMRFKARKTVEDEGLMLLKLKLTPETIELLNRLSGGPQYYTRYITALVRAALQMPTIFHLQLQPKNLCPPS